MEKRGPRKRGEVGVGPMSVRLAMDMMYTYVDDIVD